MPETPLDRAQAAMTANPEDDALRLAFYDRLASAELFVLLEAEATGDEDLSPQVFPLDEGHVILAFDGEDRLTDFTGGPAPYAALPGRALAQVLAWQGVGLGLNLGAASEILLPAEALDWLAEILGQALTPVDARPEALSSPSALPEKLLSALDARLATAEGLAECAYLAEATYDDGHSGLLLAILDAEPGAEAALSQTVAEALTFSGLDTATLDIAYCAATDAVADRLAEVAIRIDLPLQAAPTAPTAPGSDPARPPRLK